MEWSDRCKDARAFLYGTDELEPDFAEAYRLFIEEAETVKCVIADLVKSDRIRKEQRWRKNGGKSSNMYYNQ